MAPLLQILVSLAIAGVILWAITQIPMDAVIAKFIRVLVIVVVSIWLILVLAQMAGLYPGVFPYRR